jgi:hypothetical protein
MVFQQQVVPPHRPRSQRQASKGTFSRIRQHQRAEDQAFAAFEAANAAAMRRPKLTNTSPYAPGTLLPAAEVPLPPAAPAAGSTGTMPDGQVMVAKRKRGRPPKPRPLVPVPLRPLLCGELFCNISHIGADQDSVTSDCIMANTNSNF